MAEAHTAGAVHAAAAPLRPRVRRGALLGRAHDRARAAPLGARGRSCRRRTASTARSASAAPAARRSAAPAACASTANRPRLPHPPRRGRQASAKDGVIEVEPMGNMPVLKDLIVDMDAVHWKKIQRVTPWLITKEPCPSASTSSRASRWSTSRRRWPASSAAPASRTAWRWRSTRASSARRRSPRPTASSATRATTSSSSASTTSPRTRRGSTTARTASSASRPARRTSTRWARSCACGDRAGADHDIVDRNNGQRHEEAFVTLINDNGLLHEAELLPAPTAGTRGSASSTARRARAARLAAGDHRALLRRKVTPRARSSHKIPRRPEGRAADLRDGREPRRALRAEPVHHRRRRGLRAETRPSRPARRPRRSRPRRAAERSPSR